MAHNFVFALSFRIVVVEKSVYLFDNYLLSRVTDLGLYESRNDLSRTVCLAHDFDFASSFPVIVVDKIACKRM